MNEEQLELIARIENNHMYHFPQTARRIADHGIIRTITASCAKELVNICPVGRELSLALTKMEEAMFWANAAIARQEKR